MEVDCEGCAGCCLDWRPLTDADVEHERGGRYEPLDDTYNLVPLARGEIKAFVDAGLGDVMEPRLFCDDGAGTTIDGVEVAALGGRPAFFVGLRRAPKPVAPFEADPRWLDTCVFLDPTTLQCRIHGTDRYPQACGDYPGENLHLDVETECERVERVQGGDRLLEGTPPESTTPRFGPGAVGTTVFSHPDPDRLEGVIERLKAGEMTDADRAEFVSVAAASSPGTKEINDDRYETIRETVVAADSWVGRAIEEWSERAASRGTAAPEPTIATAVEESEGAPPTPGWNAESRES